MPGRARIFERRSVRPTLPGVGTTGVAMTGSPATSQVSTGAIYCRVPHRHDPDQSGVDDQERQCRVAAAALGIHIPAEHVCLDNQRLAWHRQTHRMAWNSMLHAATVGQFEHLLIDKAVRLHRTPCDLATLLEIADQYGIAVYGAVDGVDLHDPTQRAGLRERLTRACQARQRAAQQAKSSYQGAVTDGRAHGGGRRPYGYDTARRIIDGEATIITEIFARFLAGESVRAIAWDLNTRNVPTAYGARWSTSGVARLLDAPRYAGLRCAPAQPAATDNAGWRPGTWQPCVSIEDWTRTHQMRQHLAVARSVSHQPRRAYPLTGLVGAIVKTCK